MSNPNLLWAGSRAAHVINTIIMYTYISKYINTSSAEVKERVELYLCYLFLPLWQVIE